MDRRTRRRRSRLRQTLPARLRIHEGGAAAYGVSYPTVRLRLDRLIQKIRLTDQTEDDPYVALIKRLAVDDRLDLDTARTLIDAYRRTAQSARSPFTRPDSTQPAPAQSTRSAKERS